MQHSEHHRAAVPGMASGCPPLNVSVSPYFGFPNASDVKKKTKKQKTKIDYHKPMMTQGMCVMQAGTISAEVEKCLIQF